MYSNIINNYVQSSFIILAILGHDLCNYCLLKTNDFINQ